jgi:cation transport ATPase
MVGDGNDDPALKAANIGRHGKKGTEIAKKPQILF